MKYSEDQIAKAKEAIASLPRITTERKATAFEAIQRLASDLKSLQGKGYSVEQMAKVLDDQGIKVAILTLRRYLRRAGIAQPTERKRGPTSETRPTKKQGSQATQKKASAVDQKKAAQGIPTKVFKSSGFPVREDTKDL